SLAAGLKHKSQSALALLMTWFRAANYSNNTFAANNLAVTAQLFHRCTNFHHQLLEP
ncbi:hypothetical protein APX70_02119, partial [Pseudomonas syringae pv. maculicola]